MIRYFLLMFSIMLSVSAVAQKDLDRLLKSHNSHNIPYISIEELRMLQLNEKIIILDSREKEEYDISHIKGAKFVGYNDFCPENISSQFSNKNASIVVYCSIGIRSENISEKLKKEGFTNVRNLYGGIFEWKNKDYPLFDSKEMLTDNVHTFSKEWGKWLNKGVKVYNVEKHESK